MRKLLCVMHWGMNLMISSRAACDLGTPVLPRRRAARRRARCLYGLLAWRVDVPHSAHAQKIAITVGVYLEQCIAEICVVGERVHTKRVINSDVELLVKHRMDHALIFFGD